MPPLSSIDLHLHTYYSDGRAAPQELVEHAASLGMQTIAITDHDNARGSREARPFAEQLGINLIPAVELTCCWKASQAPPGKSDIDVLGYFLDLEQPEFLAFEAQILDDFHERIDIGCWYLTAEGYSMTRQDVLKENPHYAGTHPLIMAVMRKGYAPSFERALEQVDKIWKNVRPSSFTINQVISMIRQAGGVPVLAHPTIVPWPSGWLNAQAIQELVEMGLEGMEIYHPRLNSEARQYFRSLASQFDLLVTGGSDDHGWPEGFPRMGSQEVTSAMVLGLQEKAQYLHGLV
jgi:3',5'-nucleoside bisphosphate phosphatase